MKKLLLILICLFVSFEVKSEEEIYQYQHPEFYEENVSVKKCLEYHNKGKILHSFLSIGNPDTNKFQRKVKRILINYKNKVYELNIESKKHVSDGSINIGEQVENMWCHFYDLDKKWKILFFF